MTLAAFSSVASTDPLNKLTIPRSTSLTSPVSDRAIAFSKVPCAFPASSSSGTHEHLPCCSG
jgi:hypothetical protein